MSIGKKEDFIVKGAMEGKLSITNQHVMFLCEKPMVDSKGGAEKAARLAAGIVTLGWSSVVTGAMDGRKRKKIDTKLNHPYSFVFHLSKITMCVGYKSRVLGELVFFVDTGEKQAIPMFVLNHSNKFLDAFKQMKVPFFKIGSNKDWEEISDKKVVNASGDALLFIRCLNCDTKILYDSTSWIGKNCLDCDKPLQILDPNNSQPADSTNTGTSGSMPERDSTDVDPKLSTETTQMIDELKLKLAKGEITAEQFDTMSQNYKN